MSRLDDLRRKQPTRNAKPRVLIVCEGKVTEPSYLNALNQLWGTKVVLEFDYKYSAPKKIVEVAAEVKKAAKRKRREDPNEDYSAIWCVFDQDDHLLVREALQQASANYIPVAYSNPNFELWLLLHFQSQTAPLTRQEAARCCAQHMPGYDKIPDTMALLPLLEAALLRASELKNRQEERGVPRESPWTEVHELVAAIRSLGGSA